MKDERGARIRLFFALWPDATARTGLRDARDGAVDQARLTHPDDLHLTLVLIGDVEPTRLPCIEAAADDVALAGFELVLEQLETWPRQRVLVASPNDPPPALFSLVSRLQQNLLICSVEPEPRRCRPHVTLARKAPKVPRRALNIPCSARELVLVRSGIGGRSSGGGYQVLRAWPLHWCRRAAGAHLLLLGDVHVGAADRRARRPRSGHGTLQSQGPLWCVPARARSRVGESPTQLAVSRGPGIEPCGGNWQQARRCVGLRRRRGAMVTGGVHSSAEAL
jgi:2'-5' RNA ligase